MMNRMGWQLTGDLDRYLAAAGGYLRARAAEHTVFLTVAETIRARGPDAYGSQSPLFGWWAAPDGAVAGACMHTPPWPLGLTRVTAEAATELASLLADAGRAPAGVNGDPATAEAFASAWQARTGCTVTVHRRRRQYRLAGLIPPDPFPSGAARVAGPADRALLLAWIEAFGREMDDVTASPGRAVDDRLSYGGLTLWEVDGRPVSLAGLTRQVAGQVRVGPVYTPPELRGRGYAGAVTTTVSQAALAAGAGEVLLYADLANPTSNALYQRLGYQAITDHLTLLFHPPAART